MSTFVYGLKPVDPTRVAALVPFGLTKAGMRSPAASVDRSAITFVPDVDENTVAPDCTAVQVANSIKSFSTLFADYAYSVPQANILNLYSNVVGCDPSLNAILQTDGAVYLDIIGYVRQHGLVITDQLLAVPSLAVLDNSVSQLALATELYGCANIGIRIYEQDEQAIATGALLDEDGTDPGALQGRHMTMTWDYASLAPTGHWRINLYGTLGACTTRWLQARVDESYAQIWRNLVSPANVAQYPLLAAEGGFVFA